MGDDAVLEQTHESRDRYVSSIGIVNPNVLAPLINPALTGGPMWPDMRQAWRVIRRGKSTIFMSDGLSDPFSDIDAPNAGFGLEVLGETGDVLGEQVQNSWLFDLVYQASQQCAAHGSVRALLDDLGLVSMELPASGELLSLATPEGRVGVLLGIPAQDFRCEFDVPGGSVKVVTAKLLWPTELTHAVSRGAAGREELAQRFAIDGTHHRSSLTRKPVV
jgi:hypothetical protein